MKTMMLTDLITMKNPLLSLLGIDVVLGIFFTFTMQTLSGGMAAMMVIVPFMYLFSISAYDDMGGWERFRLTLPITRRQVVWGRYGSLAVVLLLSMALTFVVGHIIVTVGDSIPDAPSYLTSTATGFYQIALTVALGAAIVLLTAAVSLPLIMRFGMTKATRIVPVAMVIILATGIGFFGEADVDHLFLGLSRSILDIGADTLELGIVLAGFGVVTLYVVSALISSRLYGSREF